MKTEYPTVMVKYRITPEIESTPIKMLNLDNRSSNALQRAKAYTLGDILDRWDALEEVGQMGEKSIKTTKAAVFAFLCDAGCIHNLEMEVFE